MTDVMQRSTGTNSMLSRTLNTDSSREKSRHKSRKSKVYNERECSRNGGLPNTIAPVRANGHLQRSLKANHCNSDSNLTYTMDVAAQPPKYTRPGVALPNSLVIWLRATMSHGRATDMSEIGRLFAVATLTTCNSWSVSSPISAGVLTGQKLVDSVHPVPRENTLRDIETNRGRAIGYFSFPNLAIRQEGMFRIRITLIRVGAMIGEYGDSLQGGLSIHAVDSSPIIVDCRAKTTKVVPLTCHGHSRPVTHLSFSSIVDDDQYYIISACKDNNPMLRDGITGDWIGTFLGHKGAVWQARLSSDATMAATGSADFSANIWDTQTGEILHTLQHSHIVRAVAFPDQPRPQIIATGGAEKKLRIFDLSRSNGSPTAAVSTSTSATADSNISSNTTGTSTNNNETNNNSPASPPSYEIGPGAHTSTIKSILWTADPNLLVTAADDKKIRWWDLRARSAIEEYEVEGPIGSCELNRPGLSSSSSSSLSNPSNNNNTDDANNNNTGTNNNNHNDAGTTSNTTSNASTSTSTSTSNPTSILSIAAGKRVYFFDALKPAHLLKSISMPADVASVALHGGQRKFVTGSTADTWVRVWDYDEEKVLETGKGHHGPIWSVSFSPDGKLYATGSEDGTVKLWKCTAGSYGLWR